MSGNEAYFTGRNGGGTPFSPGDVINYLDFANYPVTIYIFDATNPNCSDEQDFDLTITCDTTWFADIDGDGFGDSSVSIQDCVAPVGYVADNTDCDDADNTVYPGAPELCDGLDNNCDGTVDEGVTIIYYADNDGDGFGDAANPFQACTAPVGYVLDDTDCDDSNNTVYPGAPELCDGLDNNCDGIIPEPMITAINIPVAVGNLELPPITGTNLSGNEAYFTGPLGTGDIYFPGDIIDITDFNSYPVTFYAYDIAASTCESEVSFTIEIVDFLSCTSLNAPINGAIDVLVDSNLSWDLVNDAAGYTILAGTTAGSSDIVNEDIFGLTTYNFANDLPYGTEIYVTIIPFNNVQTALSCFEESFVTEGKQVPPAFFTPNGDSTNDRWIVPNRLNTISNIEIYDRFGKLIKVVTDIASGWDGTYNNALLPPNDYWYVINYNTGEVLRGHFTLKR